MSEDARKDGAAAAPFIFENLQERIAQFNQALGNSEFAAVHSIIDALFTIVIDDDEDGAPNPLEHRVDLLVQDRRERRRKRRWRPNDRNSSSGSRARHHQGKIPQRPFDCPRPRPAAHRGGRACGRERDIGELRFEVVGEEICTRFRC